MEDQGNKEQEKRTVRVLILDLDRHEAKWQRLFDEIKDDLKDLVTLDVHCSSWENCSFSCYSQTGCIVTLVKKKPSVASEKIFTTENFKLTRNDFVLVRTLARSSTSGGDHRRELYGLMYCGIQGINNLYSIYCCLERPIAFGAMLELLSRLKDDSSIAKEDLLPIIEQVYYPTFQDMHFTPSYPIVVKAGHSHAGFGKMRLSAHNEFEDFASVMALYSDYCTAEPFITAQYDIRIQRIGQHTRVFKRVSSHEWKGNVGSAIIEEIEILPRYRLWADQCSTLFGGLDIFAIDLVVDKEGKEIILELNDCSIGLVPELEDADMKNMRDLLLDKILKASVSSTAQGQEATLNDTSVHVGEVLQQLEKVKKEHKAAVKQLSEELDDTQRRASAKVKEWQRITTGVLVSSVVCLLGIALKLYLKK